VVRILIVGDPDGRPRCEIKEKNFSIRGESRCPGDIPAVGYGVDITVVIIGNLDGAETIVGIVEENFPVVTSLSLLDNIAACCFGKAVFKTVVADIGACRGGNGCQPESEDRKQDQGKY